MKITMFLSVMAISSISFAEELIVVASPLAAELSKKSCFDYLENDPDSILQEVCMDRVFNLAYKIKEVVSGVHTEDIIEAIDFYHYSGLPDHMMIDPVCVTFVFKHGEYVHLESAPVKKTNSGYSCASTID